MAEHTLQSLLPEVVDGMRRDFAIRKGAARYRPTGLAPFDEATGGLRPGSLHLVTGAPGTGKTALSLKVALNMAGYGYPAYYVCGPESPGELVRKALLAGVGVTEAQLRRGRFTKKHWEKLVRQCSQVAQRPVTFVEAFAAAREAIEAAKTGDALIVVDGAPADPGAVRAFAAGTGAAVWAVALETGAPGGTPAEAAWLTHASTWLRLAAPTENRRTTAARLLRNHFGAPSAWRV